MLTERKRLLVETAKETEEAMLKQRAQVACMIIGILPGAIGGYTMHMPFELELCGMARGPWCAECKYIGFAGTGNGGAKERDVGQEKGAHRKGQRNGP